MVISGIFIETIPGNAKMVSEQLEEIDGVEVHHIEEDYKIVFTLETETVDQSYRISETFKTIDGVLAIYLVYTNFEDEPFYKEAAALK